MKYYVIAGEASGDLHASNLLKELKKLDSTGDFRCWGGDLMEKQGAKLVKHYRDLAFMGFVEVIGNIRTILRNIDLCKKDIRNYRPDALILVDYPGFNLRIAEFAKDKGIKVFYYISPQIWAWKQNRVHKIKRVVDRMFVILPFEKTFYEKFNCKVDFVGHPLLDAIEGLEKTEFNDFVKENSLTDKPIIALLPGSRKQEVKRMLNIMLSVKDAFPDFQFVIAGAPSLDRHYYKPFIGDTNVSFVENKTYSLLQHSAAALVTSGTATLETALLGVPEVVCYRANKISYHIAKKLIKVKYISLVNLIMDKEIVKELIQDELNKENLKGELIKILQNQSYLNALKENYILLKENLGGAGASARTAKMIVDELISKSSHD